MPPTIDLQLLEIITHGVGVSATTFTPSGKYLVGGTAKNVRVWRVADEKQVATMPVQRSVLCVAASRDDRWIAAGTSLEGDVYVWDATTYEQVFTGRSRSADVNDLDFSPDSTRLVSAVAPIATVWDIGTGQQVRTLSHSMSGEVAAAKYSPQGNRIATATCESVRVWDSNDGRLLVDIDLPVKGWQSLLWCDNHLFFQTKDGTIKEIDAATGSTVSEWPVSGTDKRSRIALPQHGNFIAHSSEKTVTFWDTVTHTQLGLIQHTHDIFSFVLSSDDSLLAIAPVGSGIIVKKLFQSVSEPELDIDSAALDAWECGQFEDAEALLSAEIPTSKNRHDVFTSRALVRARLGQWDAALADATESIGIQRSLVGYVAKCVALVGKGEKDKGFHVCDIAFLHFHSEHVTFLLLIKIIVLFMAGEHVNAILRMDDLITDLGMVDPVLYIVQANMHVLLGNTRLESSDYERAIQSFEAAQIKLRSASHLPPLIVSLIPGWKYDDLAITIQQGLGEALFAVGRTKEAGECVLRMVNQEINMTEPTKTWFSEFKHRCRRRLEDLGDSGTAAKQYDQAVSHYSTAMLLDHAGSQDLLVKRSRAYAQQGKWEDALNDVNEVIKLDPLSPSGYEKRYAALLGMGRHDDAIDAFETMLSKMLESSDPEIRERSHHYVRPEQTMEAIRACIQNAILDSPLVLINALSGRLSDKSEQAAAFEWTPAFVTLVTSMTTQLDLPLIERVVEEFYRYATFSHTWEGNEPLYAKVINIVVYDLDESPTHNKLQMFCKIIRDEGFNWAWSDTCCIDKGNHFILQEALVSMFRWYEGSAMTIIFLYDVDRLAEIGALIRSKWNSRGWTLQEYHASKVVRVYTKDWTPYLGLTIYNHKESPEIISEMEEATGISAQSLRVLRPGLNDIREKLRLAATRQTTRAEDAAYSLLGIFSVTLPVTYGEGNKALGRLLSQLLTSSGDTSILAWTGKPGSFNSCLPANIVVFSQPVSSYIPSAIPYAEMEIITTRLYASELDLDLVTRLHDRVDELPTPTFAAQRMRLPCLAFKIETIIHFQNGSDPVFRAEAGALGTVEIKSSEHLAGIDSLYLVHPWIDFLLDRRAVGNMVDTIASEEDEASDRDEFFDACADLSDGDLPSPTVPPMLAQISFLARLRRPFGALLLAPTRRNMAEYKRIATECLVTVQVEEITSATLNSLIRGVRVLDVL